MKDIAQEANVSQSTVSRALRNDPRITDPVKKRVAEAARKLNYTPNPYISALTAQVRSYRRAPLGATIALLDCRPEKVSHKGHYKSYIKGIETRAEKLGFTVDKIRMEEIEYSFRTLNRILRSRSITSLLILPVPQDFSIKELQMEHLAIATIDPSLHYPHIHRSLPDYFQGMLLALNTLWKKGYRRIGFCTNTGEMERIGALWHGAYLHWQNQNPYPPKLTPLIRVTDLEKKPLEEWLHKNRPDAIVSNMTVKPRELQELGLSVPGDIAYAALSTGHPFPNISGVNQQFEEVAARGIDLLAGQIYRNEYGLPDHPMSVSSESTWFENGTTPER